MTDNFQSMMSDFLKSAQKMSEAFKEANPGAKVDHSQTVEGRSGAGDLTVTAMINLKLQVQSIKFSPNVLEEKQEVVEEMVASAVNDAIARAQKQLQQEMMQLTQNMGLGQQER